MNDQIPLGQPESDELEFKGKEVLQRLYNVSREVVGMLNASGGQIWIGLGEEEGRAVRVEPIAQPEREASRLKDHLSDVIEPSPSSDEFAVEQVSLRAEHAVLRVRVKPKEERKPYALVEGTARHFLKRVHDRLRPMSREEIFLAYAQGAAPDQDHEVASRKIREARDKLRDSNCLWLRIQPVGKAKLTLSGDYRPYFVDHSRTGNRLSGWNFVGAEPFRAEPGKITCGARDGVFVAVFCDGAVEFSMPLINLYWKTTGYQGDKPPNEIWPFVLLEYPASIFRLAATICRERRFPAPTFLADLVLFGIAGWTLRPHSPSSLQYKLAKPRSAEGKDILAPEPLSFSRDEIVGEPDRCAFRLVGRVYEAFGLFEEEMPAEFDRKSGRLILPGP